MTSTKKQNSPLFMYMCMIIYAEVCRCRKAQKDVTVCWEGETAKKQGKEKNQAALEENSPTYIIWTISIWLYTFEDVQKILLFYKVKKSDTGWIPDVLRGMR